jgi:hypothetical protein
MSIQSNQDPGPMARLIARINLNSRPRNPMADPRIQTWRSKLPARLSTQFIEQEDPDALGQIAREWHDRSALAVLFHRLLYKNKLSPRSYSLEVLTELTELREYALVVVHRSSPSVWDELYDLRY